MRSARSTAVADAKRAALLAEVNALNIQVPVIDLEVLTRRAMKHRNDLAGTRAYNRGETVDLADAGTADEAAVQRWTVNYLRHVLTEPGQLALNSAVPP